MTSVAVEQHPTRIRPLQARDHAQQGALPAAARAEDGKPLAVGQVELDAGERLHAVEGDGELLGAQGAQSVPRLTAIRSASSTAAAVSAMRTTARAAAYPALTAPGRPRNRKIATGAVGQSPRAMKTVAPNSPREMANAKPAATPKRAQHERQIDFSPNASRRRAEDGGGLAQALVDRAQGRGDDPDDEGRGHERLGHRDEPGRRAEVERRLVERDHEAEAEHHGGGPQRQHHDDVEPGPRRAGRRRTPRAPPTTRARAVAGAAKSSELRTACQGTTSSAGVSSPRAR